ncbi:MAG: hypothetical protein H6Q14_2634 [Bacteroidetes bacterium]|nr:hypothetical protein [Bacteroidota bacterium]
MLDDQICVYPKRKRGWINDSFDSASFICYTFAILNMMVFWCTRGR